MAQVLSVAGDVGVSKSVTIIFQGSDRREHTVVMHITHRDGDCFTGWFVQTNKEGDFRYRARLFPTMEVVTYEYSLGPSSHDPEEGDD